MPVLCCDNLVKKGPFLEVVGKIVTNKEFSTRSWQRKSFICLILPVSPRLAANCLREKIVYGGWIIAGYSFLSLISTHDEVSMM